MRLAQLLIATFLIVPLVEIWLLITVGGVVGVGWTIFLVVLTAVIGASLVRAQGLATLARSRSMLDQGELPALELLEGVALLLAGALLLTPGFFTDAVGFVLLVPAWRRGVIKGLLKRQILRPHDPGPASADPGRRTLEGDFRRLDE
ncbi:MAG: FxsA family protein [Acidiferrobacterales bacterium]